MATDFRSLLTTPMDEIKRPPALPAGTYHGVVGKHAFGESRQKKTPQVQYELSLQSAGEDVPETELEGIDLAKKNLSVTFYLTEDARFRVKDFLSSCGVQTEGRSLGECIPEATNARVLVAITQRNSEDGTQIFNDVGTVRGEQ